MMLWWKMCVCERSLWPSSVAFVHIAWQFLQCIILLFPGLKQLKRSGFSVCVCGWSQRDPVFSVSHALFLVASFTGENHSVLKTRLNQLPWIFSPRNPENYDRPFVSVGTVHSEPGFPSSRMPRYSASRNCLVHIFCNAGTRAELCH